MKFRKKPIVIDAVRYSNEMRVNDTLPEGVYIVPTEDGDQPVIHTLEGDMIVREGDWVIRGVKGEFYPCKDDIFQMTYEPAEEKKQCDSSQPSS